VDFEHKSEEKKKPDLKTQEESKVGKKLSDKTTKRTIVLVFAMMFSVPLLNTYTYFDLNNSFTLGLQMLNALPYNSTGFNALEKDYLLNHKNIRTPIVEYGAYNYTWRKENYNIFKLRTTEFTLVTGD